MSTTFAIQPGQPDRGVCRGCAQPILWTRTAAGKPMCLDRLEPVGERDGLLLVSGDDTHWATCKVRGMFVKPKAKA